MALRKFVSEIGKMLLSEIKDSDKILRTCGFYDPSPWPSSRERPL